MTIFEGEVLEVEIIFIVFIVRVVTVTVVAIVKLVVAVVARLEEDEVVWDVLVASVVVERFRRVAMSGWLQQW